MSQDVYFAPSQTDRALSTGGRQSPAPLSRSRPMIDRFALIPILACIFATIVSPLEYTLLKLPPYEDRIDTKIFWPVMAAISVVSALRNHSRLPRPFPSHLICLFAYLAFAGASVLWAFNPGLSLARFAQQAMIVTCIVLPTLLAAPGSDILRGLFLWCFAPAKILNVAFVFENSPSIVAALKGYPGFFMGKNYLGEFAAIPFLLALHEMLYSGWRRVFGAVILVVATWLLFWANSKTAFGLALLVPLAAGLTLLIRRVTRLSPAVILLSVPLCFIVLSSVSHFGLPRLSYMLYGDSSLTGRTVIWDFANTEIARHPLLGWGYQSFWLAGPDAPSVTDAPGWVKQMPDGHSGYVDTKLELGYVGFALLISFILATLHGVGRMADRAPTRAWLVLSLALYVIVYNFLESLWMRGYEFLWVMFVILAAEIGRYGRPIPLRRAARGLKRLGRRPPPGARAQPRAGLS